MSVTNLPYIQQQMIQYGVTIYFILGIIGNTCNCIMFTRLTYRSRPSSIYFLFLSIGATMYLVWTTFPLFYSIDHIDPQKQSVFYCKVRFYGTVGLSEYNRYTVVFACIDRYLITQTNARLRLLSTNRMAIKLLSILFVICCVTAAHLLVFMDVRNGVCGMFGLYKLGYAIYQIIFVGGVPPILMVTFSTLTIRNLRQLHGPQTHVRQNDRYLLRMLIAEVVINVVTSIPYSANLIYGTATYYVDNKSAQRVEIETFITFGTQFLIYFLSAVPFYLFILTSRPFRTEFLGLFLKCRSKTMHRHSRIVPAIPSIR